ncbi:MAG: GNAT family N-acetyltransferase [Ignavibacteriaceae bacterium]|jgi:ribosomal-protein-alanine N-acetyltransferase
MLDYKIIRNDSEFLSDLSRNDFIDFLHQHLERFGDTKEAISKSIDYAFSDDKGKGGFLLTAYDDDKLIGELVMNKTGMDGYIPENILVYVAVDSSCRGKGYGREICEKAIGIAEGNVALHVEYDNPAKRLYERIGFTTKYAEMRLIK